jgi:HlyD family secretion protein
MKKKLYLLTIVLLIGCTRNDDAVKPVVKPLVEAVYASGFVVSKDEYEITAQVEGYVAEKLVSDGDVILKNEPLYIISSDQQSARNRIARETYDLAATNYRDNSPVLQELRSALDASETKMKFDSSNLVRYQNLLSNNATSKMEHDRIKLLYENSLSEYQLQKSRYEKVKSQLYLDLQNAKNNLAISADERGRYVVRSEVEGMVFSTTKEKGELIRRGEVVAVAGKKDAYYLQLNVDELDIQRLKIGQEVLVKIDAYPGRIFKASISKIYPMVDRRQQAVRADAELKEKLPSWFSGLALEANIIIRQKNKALVIQKSALLPGDSVLIQRNDEVIKVKVAKGVQTLDEVEIIEGLDSTDFIVMAGK